MMICEIGCRGVQQKLLFLNDSLSSFQTSLHLIQPKIIEMAKIISIFTALFFSLIGAFAAVQLLSNYLGKKSISPTGPLKQVHAQDSSISQKSDLKVDHFKQKSVQSYQVNMDSTMTDLSALSQKDRLSILKTLNDKYAYIEKSEFPAAGYKVIFSVVSPTKRPLEIYLETIGKRKKTEAMKMPSLKGKACPFCENNEVMSGYEKATTVSAQVIQSLQKNPLSITNDHWAHFFSMPLDIQDQLLETSIKIIDNYKKLENKISNRYFITFHVGVEGNQTIPHAHGHVYTCIGTKK